MPPRKNAPQASANDLDLARVKFEYCAKLFKQESDNFEYLEKKAQLFSSFIAIFLGAIALNTEFLATVKKIITSGVLGMASNALFFLLTAFSVLIFSALILLASVASVQYWMVEHPDNLAFTLYAPNSEFLKMNNEFNFLNEMGYRYSLAIEFNRKITEKKSKKLDAAMKLIFSSILCLCLSLILVFAAL